MGIIRNARKHRTLVATMILVGASCLGLSFCGSLSSSPNAFSISESHTDVNVNLVNGVAIRILNSAATAEITELDLSTTAAPTGTFVTDNFKVEVSTANKTGYKLYMNSSYQNSSTSTYTTDLVNQANTSYTIPTVAAAVSKTDLSTAAPGTTNANKWAYSLDDTTYSPVPANSVQTQIGSHDTPTAGTRTPVYIGMNVNVEKPSGVYKNQLTFSAVGNPVPTDYSLYFEPGGTGVSGLPETMTYSGVASSYTFTIPSTAPTRDGYGFTGYSDGSTTYQPGDTITIVGDIDYTGTATLTAQWEQNFWTITTMQQMTTAICNTVYTPSNATGSAVTVITDRATYESTVTADNQLYVAQSTLRDIRDNNNYTVRKLADGNCWMVNNLKYSLSANSTRIGVNHSTNETFEFNTGTACETDGACIMNGNTVMTEQVTNGGYYYSWYAATAGTGTPSMASSDAAGSICPRGWRLPANYTIDPTKSYGSITDAYVNGHGYISGNYVTTLESVPLSFMRAGQFQSGSFNNGNVFSLNWSSTADASTAGRNLAYTSTYLYSQQSDVKYVGRSVRCVNTDL